MPASTERGGGDAGRTPPATGHGASQMLILALIALGAASMLMNVTWTGAEQGRGADDERVVSQVLPRLAGDRARPEAPADRPGARQGEGAERAAAGPAAPRVGLPTDATAATRGSKTA